MEFLRCECETTGATIIYATHIFDGLEAWPTHLMYLAHGKLQVSLCGHPVWKNACFTLPIGVWSRRRW